VEPAASQSSGVSQRRSGEEDVSSGADMGAGSVSATCQNAAPVTGDINSDEVNGERLGRHLGSTARVDSRLGGRPRSEPKAPGQGPKRELRR
jgi:hypothetical protein